MAATYNHQVFDTPLLAQWAAFFDLAGWHWSRGVSAVGDWQPDFRITFDCGHSECRGSHTILASVLPVAEIAGVKGHPAFRHNFGVIGPDGTNLADAGAVFGNDPKATYWQMTHGAGGGVEDATYWANNADGLWQQAKDLIAEHVQPLQPMAD